jgi:hypothetical protein
MNALDTRRETTQDIAEWMGPTLARSVAEFIIDQVKRDVETQKYTIEFEIDNYRGSIKLIMGTVDAGGYKLDWNGATP